MRYEDAEPRRVDGFDEPVVVGYFGELEIVQRVWTAVADPGFRLESFSNLELLTLLHDDTDGLMKAAAAVLLRREQALAN